MKEANFKETEIGKIPVDWELKTLEKLGIFSKGKGIKKDEVIFEGLPCIRYGEIYTKYDSVVKEINSFISDETSRNSKEIKKGDVLFAGSGETKEDIGKCITYNLDEICFAGGDIIIFTSINTNNEFLGYLLNHPIVQKQKAQIAQGDAVVHIYANGLKEISIPLPPLAEQEKIAEVLSDTDLWIESTEALLAKKRQIKKGAMQKLLSPKEDWDVKSIIEIINNDRKLFNDGDWVESVHIKSDEIRLLQTGNIGIGKFLDRASKKYISEESFKQLNCKEVFENDILICRLAEPAGRCCLMPKIDEEKLIVSVDVSILRPDEKLYDRRFLVYIMCTDEWFNNVTEKVGGTTHKRISRSNLGEIKFSLPPLKTQQEIAEILSSMDLEIESLENRLQKARNIKQGMMQDLLTGKVRLVD